jgi:hypothetical protein
LDFNRLDGTKVDLGNWIAVLALVLAVALALLNRAHSEKLFRRSHYPAVGGLVQNFQQAKVARA